MVLQVYGAYPIQIRPLLGKPDPSVLGPAEISEDPSESFMLGYRSIGGSYADSYLGTWTRSVRNPVEKVHELTLVPLNIGLFQMEIGKAA